MTAVTRGRRPSFDQKQFVSDLISRVGLKKAAGLLGLSETSTLSVSAGRPCYSGTLTNVRELREKCPTPKIAGYLKDGTPVFYGEAPPEESPLKIAILGVKRQPGAPEPVCITSVEEWREHYPNSSPPRELFDVDIVTVIDVLEESPPEPLYVGDGYPRIARRQR